MLDILIKNASELVTCKSAGPKTGHNLDELGIIKQGSLAMKDGKIIALGNVEEPAKEVIDASNKVVMPGFIDCHTHSVFAGSRENEFVQKIEGKSYLEILQEGGGIFNTVAEIRKASAESLVKEATARLDKFLEYGTTTVEIKSGYGLSTLNELKILLVIWRLKEEHPVSVISTFLGAHACPSGVSREIYIKEVLEMIREFSSQRFIEYCDVFLEKDAFTLKEAEKILRKARSCGLKLKLHAGQFNDLGGSELGARMGVSSIDHLDYISEKGMRLMARKKIIGVLLPGVPFHLMTGHYAPARKLVETGVPIALATDFNPGSCPTFSMQMIIALACRYMKLTPAEAINAATINAAYALDRGDTIGSLEVGKKADVIILDIPTHRQLPYWFGMNLVGKIIKNGKIVR